MDILLIILILLGIFTLAWWITSFIIRLAETFNFVESIIDKARHHDNRNR